MTLYFLSKVNDKKDTHKAALTTMGCCQIDIENSEEFLKQ